MKYLTIVAHFFATTVCALTIATSASSERTFWDYGGAAGPENWSALADKFSACGLGHEQSPIDLAAPVATDFHAVGFNWNSSTWTVMNDGHTLRVRGANTDIVMIDDEAYELMQFDFHTPSEHAIDGVHAPMEVHFVHQHANGNLAVIAALIEGGGSNNMFDAIMHSAPAYNQLAKVNSGDIRTLLPANTELFRYFGSLTTPPCSEIVLWSVFKEPVQVSDAAIAAFEAMFGTNARPLQPVNRRFVLEN